MEGAICFLAGGLLAGLLVRQYFRRRESRLMDSLQHMVDGAISGSFETEHLDESKLSAVENSLKQFLDGSLLAEKNQARQKDTIQTLISDISHQTVTPIANIKLYLELFEERQGDCPKEILAVKEQSEKLDFLIQSLVRLSRMESGILTLSPRENDLGRVFEAVRVQFASKAEVRGICLEVEETSLSAVFDLKWTTEAIGNLVDNAVKYTPACGKVSVRAQSYQFFARIDIQDNGIGIREQEQGKIFGRFYRSSQVSEEEGVGIGLYLTREILQAQKGYVKVDSRPGEGSLFSVFLPLKKVSKL